MKKSVIRLVVNSVIVVMASVGIANAEAPTVYGKVNVSLESVDKQGDDTRNFVLNSNASRLGIKGTKKVDDGLTAVYRVEFETAVDDGDTKNGMALKQRNIYGGLTGNWGQVIAGKFDSPLKLSQAKVDVFNDITGDIKQIMAGETRANNMIQYSTPKMNGVVVNFALQPGEQTGAAASRDGVADGLSASLVYTGVDNLYVALAIDSDFKEGSGGLDVAKGAQANITRVVASYKLSNGLKLGGLYQLAETVDVANNQDISALVSATYGLANGVKLKAEYGQTTNDAGSNTKTLASVGADYGLGNKSKLFGFATQIDEDTPNSQETYIGLGFETKF